ncbi:MAG: Fe(2+) transporter permease subunit FeoB [Pseudomonadales bacterium]|nr:Fe(2+) transporter permease subunit FeoB [Pseudomonadales bacterium]
MTASVALIGNPNCGKTTVFNALTGGHQRVGNWPGVTVEKRSGFTSHGDQRLEVVDLPGIYSLLPSDASDALDERVAREYLELNPRQIIVNVVDASSLARGLFLTTQLLDLDASVIVALNMMDIADRQGIHIDTYRLSQALGCPVVPLVATREDGLGPMIDMVLSLIDNPETRKPVYLGDALEKDIDGLSKQLIDRGLKHNTRLISTALLSGSPVSDFLKDQIPPELDYTPQAETVSVQRYMAIDTLLQPIVTTTPVNTIVTDVIDRVVLQPILAFPVFLLVIYTMFMFTINIGGAFIDLFDLSAWALFVEGPRQIYQSFGFPIWLSTFLADGIGGGMQLVASFIPVIGCMFLFLSFLEGTGYLGRAAFIIDRLMRQIGLPGKSFVPLIVGFGCNVPAVMAARSLDNQQDRILTTVMAPYMSCGARLTVYALFAAAFFRDNGQNIVFALYIIGISVAILSALLVRKHMLGRDVSAFTMELPLYHLPSLRSLLIHTWYKLRGFIMRAGKAIVAVVVILNVVSSVGMDGSFGNQDTDQSALAFIGKSLTPLLKPMGIQEENWPATVGIFTGIFAKEVVVGTLDALYDQIDKDARAAASGTTLPHSVPTVGDPEFSFFGTLKEAAGTVPENFSQLSELISDPLGLDLGDLNDVSATTEAQEVRPGTLTVLQNLFVNPLAAFSYLLFILLYVPCIATIGAVLKELGLFWATFTTIWSIVMAYVIAVLTYQLGSLFVPSILLPATSVAIHVAATLLLALLCFFLLIRWGKSKLKLNLIPVTNI